MSYCRWSSPVEDMVPDVDLSIDKMMELYKTGGYDSWKQYMIDNNVPISEAYVYEHYLDYFVCHWHDEDDFTCDTAKEMADYLTERKSQGKLIPQSAIDELDEE